MCMAHCLEQEDNPDLCRCDCHAVGVEVRHCVPCCRQCPHCGQEIRVAVYESHIVKCEDSLKEQQEKCHCLCHQEYGKKCNPECCSLCHCCGKRIAVPHYAEHIERCQRKKNIAKQRFLGTKHR